MQRKICMKQKYYCWHPAEQGFMSVITPFLNSNMVLDIGCGNGWVGKILKEYNKNVTILGLDNDLVALKEAKQSEEPILCDAKQLPFVDHAFDGIIAKDVLEHSFHVMSIMQECSRVLKKDGKMYISVPDTKSKTFWDDYTHIRPYTKISLTHLLEDTGFTIEKLWYNMSLPGLGIVMRLFNMNELPSFVKFIARLGIHRQNVIAVAIKKSL